MSSNFSLLGWRASKQMLIFIRSEVEKQTRVGFVKDKAIVLNHKHNLLPLEIVFLLQFFSPKSEGKDSKLHTFCVLAY